MEQLKLLVVDDEPGIRSGVVRILKNHTVSYPFMDEDYGFICLEAGSGEEGLEIIDRERPEIVLLDNKLPGMKGTEVLEIIRRNGFDTTVAMITSYASLEIAVKATDDGAYDFIPKPFTPQELKASIDNIVKQLYLRRITQKMQQEGKRIRYQFLSIVSHELKAPLNAIEGYLQIMKDRKLGEDLENYDELIERSLGRVSGMRGLIMDLLDFTKIRLEKKEDKVEKVDIYQRARLAVATAGPMAIQKNVTIHLEAEQELMVEINPSDIDIIFNNLLSNAVKYNVNGGEVWLSVTTDSEGLLITVRDSGIGMSEEELSTLFKEFVRIRNDRTRDITGSGLGLSIVKKLADLYGGRIDVKSSPDKGSEFSVYLPVK